MLDWRILIVAFVAISLLGGTTITVSSDRFAKDK
jgi:hypothetical protein